jgi:hypothetical protein
VEVLFQTAPPLLNKSVSKAFFHPPPPPAFTPQPTFSTLSPPQSVEPQHFPTVVTSSRACWQTYRTDYFNHFTDTVTHFRALHSVPHSYTIPLIVRSAQTVDSLTEQKPLLIIRHGQTASNPVDEDLIAALSKVHLRLVWHNSDLAVATSAFICFFAASHF